MRTGRDTGAVSQSNAAQSGERSGRPTMSRKSLTVHRIAAPSSWPRLCRPRSADHRCRVGAGSGAGPHGEVHPRFRDSAESVPVTQPDTPDNRGRRPLAPAPLGADTQPGRCSRRVISAGSVGGDPVPVAARQRRGSSLSWVRLTVYPVAARVRWNVAYRIPHETRPWPGGDRTRRQSSRDIVASGWR